MQHFKLKPGLSTNIFSIMYQIYYRLCTSKQLDSVKLLHCELKQIEKIPRKVSSRQYVFERPSLRRSRRFNLHPDF